MRTVLTIAGSDSSGGAGIQADLKTMTALGVYGMSAVTALTAQNTTGVSDILQVPPAFLRAQLDSVFLDIFPDAVKIGMTGNASLIHVIAGALRGYGASNIVLDPVMAATSGAALMEPDGLQALRDELLPLASVVTPNLPEAGALAEMEIRTGEDMETAARRIFQRYGCACLCKGGHRVEDANDVLISGEGTRWFYGKRVSNPNSHGTGCTLSSAIASCLAMGVSLPTAVESAKRYVEGALAAGLDLGKGSGPLDHGYRIRKSEDN